MSRSRSPTGSVPTRTSCWRPISRCRRARSRTSRPATGSWRDKSASSAVPALAQLRTVWRHRALAPLVAQRARQAFRSHMTAMDQQAFAPSADNNPLDKWNGRFGVPAFDRIKPEHFRAAFARAFAAHAAEIAAIVGNTAAPTFANTIAALETSGEALTRTVDVFDLLAGAHNNEEILAIEREVAPVKAKHWDSIHMDATLFGRVERLYRARDQLALSAEERRVLERYYVKFVRAGAALDAAAKARLADINARLATLGTAFSQNVLADEQSFTLALDGEEDLAGLPDFVRTAARAAAEERGFPGKHVIPTSRSSIEPFLQFSARRELREKAFRAWIARGDNGGATDNKPI